MGHSFRHIGIKIPEPTKLSEKGHGTYVTSGDELEESLLKRAYLNYVGHWACVRKARAGA